MTDDSPARRKRRTVTSAVTWGGVGGGRLDLPGEKMNHVSGEVNIEVSGATGDYPLPARLSREIEAAVVDVLERADRIGEEADAQRRTPDDRPIDDISAVSECDSCKWGPAAIILTDGGWECYNCGDDPNERTVVGQSNRGP
jgi:hypothetical protein